jgi:hypothetical protein
MLLSKFIKQILVFKFVSQNLNALEQGFSNCGKRTTSGTPATVQWYTGLVRKIRGLK